jgi:hypothetical protein
MSTSGFTLRLEYLAERKGVEPVELVREFPIDTYVVGDHVSVQGTFIFGVEILTHAAVQAAPPTYRFHRVDNPTAPPKDHDEARIRCMAVKLRWDDSSGQEASLTGFYPSRATDVVATALQNDPGDGRWLLVLKETGGDYTLVYQLKPAPGNADTCADLDASGIKCKNTTITSEKLTCKACGCPTK